MTYILKLPVDRLKIDKSFIDGITESEKEFQIVQHIIDLAHSFGAEIILEGLETAEQQAILAEM